MIPKIIHYCWLSNEPFPDDVQAYMATWKKHLPDYEFKLWNFSCFDIESSRWVKEAFMYRKYAFAADYIRIYALYNYGGIYLDTDVEVLKSYNDLLELPYFIGRERSKDEGEVAIEAATIGFEKGHPLLKDILNYYDKRKFHIKGRKFDIRTLPYIILIHIQKNYMWKRVKSVADFDYDSSIITLLPEDYFSPKTWFSKELAVTPNTYSIHHFAGSWKKKHKWEDKMRVWRFRFLGLFMDKYKI